MGETEAQKEVKMKEDLRNRCHVGASVTDLLSQVGVISDLQESNQMRLTDFFGEMV